MSLGEDSAVDFTGLLRSSVRAGLSDILGKSGTDALIMNFRLQDSLADPSLVHNALVHAFGQEYAPILERSIAKELFREMGEMYSERADFDFGRVTEEAKKIMFNRAEAA